MLGPFLSCPFLVLRPRPGFSQPREEAPAARGAAGEGEAPEEREDGAGGSPRTDLLTPSHEAVTARQSPHPCSAQAG